MRARVAEPTGPQLEMLRWAACIGAVTAEALAEREGCSVASARGRLLAAERRGQLTRSRPLSNRPALFAPTRAGLRVCRLRGLVMVRVNPANAAHTIACAAVAGALERRYPDHRVMGEPELRLEERELGTCLASVRVGSGCAGVPLIHRPDLVLLPREPGMALPVPVEVELTVKAPRRLQEICLAWARAPSLAGVLYLVSPEVERPLLRAIERAQASRQIVVVPLEGLLAGAGSRLGAIARTVPGGA